MLLGFFYRDRKINGNIRLIQVFCSHGHFRNLEMFISRNGRLE